jgi:transcriptional regulator with XRE-family HTH domain
VRAARWYGVWAMTSRLFSALLRYWRGRRGLSQLELALEADVSARHVSFLESGRAQPSAAMVLKLFSVLSVPLRDQNQALRAAGLEPHFAEPALDALPPEIDSALTQMMAQHEPYPLTVLSVDARVVRSNRAAQKVFEAFIAEPSALPEPLDTLNGTNPVSSTTSCSATSYLRGFVRFTETTKGYSFSYDLQGCTNTAATFTANVFPGTYKVAVNGDYSNLPDQDYVVISQLAVP